MSVMSNLEAGRHDHVRPAHAAGLRLTRVARVERVHPGIAWLPLFAPAGEGSGGWVDWPRQEPRAAPRPEMAFAEGS